VPTGKVDVCVVPNTGYDKGRTRRTTRMWRTRRRRIRKTKRKELF
jgi:hypothetical protein